LKETTEESGILKVAFSIPGIDAEYANAIQSGIVTLFAFLILSNQLYPFYQDIMMMELISHDKRENNDANFRPLSSLSTPMLIKELIKGKKRYLGLLTLLFYLVVAVWESSLAFGLHFQPIVTEGGQMMPCLEWSNEGPESLGTTISDGYTLMYHTYISNETEGKTSVGSFRDKELLRRSIAQGSFGLFKVPTLTGGDAIEEPNNHSPQGYFHRREGLLTFYKSMGAKLDYNPNRRANEGIEYGPHSIYEPTNMTFGGDEEVAVIHGLGSVQIETKDLKEDCKPKLLGLVMDAEGTDDLKYDSYENLDECTGTLVVRSQDFKECAPFMWDRNIAPVENLIGAFRFFSNETREDGSCALQFVDILQDQRLIFVETNSTEDHIKMDPYIRALARDGYQTNKREWTARPERLTDRDAIRLTRVLAGIMSDAYRYRLDCPTSKIVVELGFRWLWLVIFGTTMAVTVGSLLVALHYHKKLSETYKFSEINQYAFWYQAGAEAVSNPEQGKDKTVTINSKRDFEFSVEKKRITVRDLNTTKGASDDESIKEC